jgi:hypothetical protein
VRRQLALAVVASLLGLGLQASAVQPVGATATPIKGTLSTAHPVLRFGAQMHNPVPVPMASDPDPTLCLVNCQLWSLRVVTTSPFLVALHNGNSSIDDGFNLYVYDPSGTQVAAASGIGANGQAVAVKPVVAGAYTVAVTMTYAFDTAASYVGEVRVMTGSSWRTPSCRTKKPCALLPALKVFPPTDVHVDGIPPAASTPLGFPFPVDIPTGFSCYVDERAQTGATRCLRFTSEVDNVGAGLLQLQVPWLTTTGKSGFVPGQCVATQVIAYSDGSSRSRAAGPCEFHPQHAHFHYKDFVAFSLHSVRADGTTGPTVAASLKESFCLADDGYTGFGSPGPNSPRTYVGQPDCNVPSLPTGAPPDALVHMGLSPGWGDIYTWDTPSQFIDISRTPAGTYDIVARANPTRALLLSGVQQSCATTRITLTDAAVTVVRSGIRCV